MQVFLDGQILPIDRPTLRAALDAARAAAGHRGRVIVEVLQDGARVPDDVLDNPPEIEPPCFELRFTTADPREVVSTSLTQVAQALGQARQDQLLAAELIQVGKLQEAFQRVGSSLAVWDSLRRAVVQGPALLGLELDTIRLGSVGGESGTVSEAVDGLAEQLREVRRAVKAQDWVGLGDVLAFELAEEADRWRDMLMALVDIISQRK